MKNKLLAEKFKKEGVDITLSVTPCWCYGSETMDMDPNTIKGVWGFNGTERPGAVYLAAIGGTGVSISHSVKKAEVIAYDDLGAEAIRKLYVEDFPAIVVIDSEGNNLYETAVKEIQ